jgi:hypothetical protein
MEFPSLAVEKLEFPLSSSLRNMLKNVLYGLLSTTDEGLTSEQVEYLANMIMRHGVRIELSKTDESVMHYITVQWYGRLGGESFKLGNIKLNAWKIFGLGCSTAGALHNISAIKPWWALCGFIALCYALRKEVTVKLTEREAITIYEMWNLQNDRQVRQDELFVQINKTLKQYERHPISESELDDSLRILEKLRCIKKINDDPRIWIVREQVKNEF